MSKGKAIRGWMFLTLIVVALVASGQTEADPLQEYGFPIPDDKENAAETLLAFDKALEAQMSGDNKLAVELYTKHIEGGFYWGKTAQGRRQMLAIAYGNRAAAYAALGAFDEALADLRATRELWAGYGKLGETEAIIFNGRAIAAINAGDLESAHADFSHAISLAPEMAQLWANRCLVASMIRTKTEARADCEKALELDPENLDAERIMREHQLAK